MRYQGLNPLRSNFFFLFFGVGPYSFYHGDAEMQWMFVWGCFRGVCWGMNGVVERRERRSGAENKL